MHAAITNFRDCPMQMRMPCSASKRTSKLQGILSMPHCALSGSEIQHAFHVRPQAVQLPATCVRSQSAPVPADSAAASNCACGCARRPFTRSAKPARCGLQCAGIAAASRCVHPLPMSACIKKAHRMKAALSGEAFLDHAVRLESSHGTLGAMQSLCIPMQSWQLLHAGPQTVVF